MGEHSVAVSGLFDNLFPIAFNKQVFYLILVRFLFVVVCALFEWSIVDLF